MITKPNIFKLATSELSQDSFFTWLLQWADPSNALLNPALNETAKDFVRLLLGKSDDFQINKVEAGRQWKNIDIWAEINDEFFISIEDKVNTGVHSEQLERYKQTVLDAYQNKNYKPVYVYLKTGNESISKLKKISDIGYLVIDRKKILSILNKRVIQNETFNDFKDHLIEIDQRTNSYIKFENLISDWEAGKGFFIKLQEIINEWSDWEYVSNPTGGFLGFWYHFDTFKDICEVYIQIENAFEYGIKLVIKISDWEPSTDTLHQLFGEIKNYASKNGISIEKPDRYRAGQTSTLAIVKNAFIVDKGGNLKLDEFIKTLKALEKTIDEFCE